MLSSIDAGCVKIIFQHPRNSLWGWLAKKTKKQKTKKIEKERTKWSIYLKIVLFCHNMESYVNCFLFQYIVLIVSRSVFNRSHPRSWRQRHCWCVNVVCTHFLVSYFSYSNQYLRAFFTKNIYTHKYCKYFLHSSSEAFSCIFWRRTCQIGLE